MQDRVRVPSWVPLSKPSFNQRWLCRLVNTDLQYGSVPAPSPILPLSLLSADQRTEPFVVVGRRRAITEPLSLSA